MTEEILSALFRANVAAGLCVLAVVVLRRPVRRMFGARAAYGLWAAPLLAGAASLFPAPAAILPPLAMTTAVVDVAPKVPPAPGLSPSILLALWAAGALIALTVLTRRQAAFLVQVRQGRGGPAVVGVIAPRIVTPSDFNERFAPAEREVILSHERAHLARGDAAANALAALLTCLCWFNPLAHLAARLVRIDQELACDATVLSRAPQVRRIYAEALLKTQLSGQAAPLGCHWPSAAAHPLKERIRMLKSPLPGRRRHVAGFAVVAGACVAAGFAAWAGQPGSRSPERSARPPSSPTLTAPDWVQRPEGADLAAVYPPAASAQSLPGSALIACRVDAAGGLEDCKLEREAPTGAGFGRAALALTGKFRMKPVDKAGVPTRGALIRIPFRFTTPQAAS